MNKKGEKFKDDVLKQQIKDWFSEPEKVVIAGIGNSIRRDDFVGVKMVRCLRERVPPYVHLIECETVPERFMYSIVDLQPSHILIIDAAMANLEPATSIFVKPHQLQEYPTISTHMIPLQVFCQYLIQETEAKLALLVIQPEDASFGEGLTENVNRRANQLIEFLSEILNEKGGYLHSKSQVSSGCASKSSDQERDQ